MFRFIVIPIFLALSILLCVSTFTIQETERGITLRFGKAIRDKTNKPIILNPGLHIKIPLIDIIKKFDSRIQTLNIQEDRYLTMENKDLIVDSYLKWKIIDFNRYYVATGGGNLYQAENSLKRKFSDRLRSEFGRLKVKDIITDSRRKLTAEIRDTLNKGTFQALQTNENIPNSISFLLKKEKYKANDINLNSVNKLGIEVVDVRIKRIELPNEVLEVIYQGMRAEREAVARRHRSQGKEEAVKIRAIADKTATQILSEAKRTALKLQGDGDSIASKLFSDMFKRDPEFYFFVRTLQTYEKIFNKNTNDIIIMSPNSSFLQYMKVPN